MSDDYGASPPKQEMQDMPVVTVEQVVDFRKAALKRIATLTSENERLETELECRKVFANSDHKILFLAVHALLRSVSGRGSSIATVGVSELDAVSEAYGIGPQLPPHKGKD